LRALDFTTRRGDSANNHWVIGNNILNSSGIPVSGLPSWSSYQGWQGVITYQIVVPDLNVGSSPKVGRVFIDKLECIAADNQQACSTTSLGGIISSTGTNTISGVSGGSASGGVELDPISTSGGFPVYDFFGPLSLTLSNFSIGLTSQCPDFGASGVMLDVGSFVLFSYVSNYIGNGAWQQRDPVHNPSDATYGGYLSMSIDPAYKRAICGLGAQPYSARKWNIGLPQPIIIGKGQALHVGMAYISLSGTSSMSTVMFARARVREID